MGMRYCKKCGQWKDDKDFYKNHRTEIYAKTCRKCQTERHKYLKNHPRLIAREGYKFCGTCNEEKLLNEFYKYKDNGEVRYRFECRKCWLSRQHLYYIKNHPESIKGTTGNLFFCQRCNQEKDEIYFNFKDKRLLSLSWCKSCFDEYDKNFKEKGIVEYYPVWECGCPDNCHQSMHILPSHRFDGVPQYFPSHEMIGRKQSKEHIEKSRKARTGKKRPEYVIIAMREGCLHGKVAQSNTSIEIKLQKIIHKNNINFDTQKSLIGRPDLFIEPNICIFADGDYWHCNPKKYHEDYLNKSIGKTAKQIWEKDRTITNTLIKNGYVVLRFWENDIKKDIDKCFEKILQVICEVKNV